MGYEEKYKEAIESIKRIYSQADSYGKELMEKEFPELKESEDEKIRRELIEFIRTLPCTISVKNEYFAWLEKQREKSADKVEPKFKVGDWITNDACIIKITSVDDRYYWHDNECIGGDIESIDKEYHLWTIQDAKDGDVLATDSGRPFIFKGLLDKDHPEFPVAYCGIAPVNYFDDDSDNNNEWWTDANVYPATKEQRELLSQKMKEAGYEWNTEKKELNWKPTEEQMKALNWVAYNYALMNKGTEENLQSLYNSLKKL